MKRIDLHIHTLPTPLDSDFSFCPDALRRHVDRNGLSVIAVTNHNLFDSANFAEVCAALPDDVTVLPGIEISVKGFHILVIANPAQIEQFKQICANITPVQQGNDGISLEEFRSLFGNGSYIVIPHYKKKPSIPADDLLAISDIVTALEVTSEKKWEYEHSRVDKPVVMFSDYRCGTGTKPSLGKYTYVTIGEITFDSLQLAFNDHSKFAITERDDHMELEPGLYASMGLNVVVGGRSSGKTFFLDRLFNSCDPDDVVYVRQFEIVKDAEESTFHEKLDSEESAIKSDYYKPMAAISSAAEGLPSRDIIIKSTKDYLSALIEYADTSVRDDEFSKCPIYSEGRLAQDNSAAERKVVESLISLLDDNPLTLEIDEIIGRDALINLLGIALERYKAKALRCKRIDLTNSIAKAVRKGLTVESRRPACPDSPMLIAAKRSAFIKRLAELRALTKKEATISDKAIGKFRRITKRVPYKNAWALKTAIGATNNMPGILQSDDTDFVESILAASGVSDISHAFFNVTTELENERGEKVSGGQRAEYLFFRALDKAGSHDIVLIDEPESSFDNPFLNELIADSLKKISSKATVFIATHNNVLGVSIKPDGIVYTDVENGIHRVYTCDSSDDTMISSDGHSKKRSEVLLQLMEAGNEAYEGRRPYYGLA